MIIKTFTKQFFVLVAAILISFILSGVQPAYAAEIEVTSAAIENGIEYCNVNSGEDANNANADKEINFSDFMENNETVKTLEMVGRVGIVLSPILLAIAVLFVIYLIREHKEQKRNQEKHDREKTKVKK